MVQEQEAHRSVSNQNENDTTKAYCRLTIVDQQRRGQLCLCLATTSNCVKFDHHPTRPNDAYAKELAPCMGNDSADLVPNTKELAPCLVAAFISSLDFNIP